MTIPLRHIRLLALWQLAIGGALAVLTGIVAGPLAAASFMTGVGVMLTNLGLLAWVWWRLLGQKTIAWTVLIIVSKYAVLLSSIFYLSRAEWFSSVSCGLGIASFVLPALVLAVITQEREQIGG